MDVYFMIAFFILGSVMGSFYHVVATRLSNNESIISPGSHCTKCGHMIRWFENIPIISYIILRGKCSNCKSKIPLSSLAVEITTGILFLISFYTFHFSYMLIVSLIFISSLIIVIVSDIENMIILDEVLVVGSILILLVFGINLVSKMGLLIGIKLLIFNHIIPGILAFTSMYMLKLFGDFLFKKESLGGGDIKLMFFVGLVLGFPLTICSIFLATFIAFPIAILIMFLNKEGVIPFGPFLSMSAIMIFISKLQFMDILNFLLGL